MDAEEVRRRQIQIQRNLWKSTRSSAEAGVSGVPEEAVSRDSRRTQVGRASWPVPGLWLCASQSRQRPKALADARGSEQSRDRQGAAAAGLRSRTGQEACPKAKTVA